MKNMISCYDLTKKYQDFTAVDTVSIEIDCGKVFGMLGPNGAGKTTLIKMLTGQTTPTSGSGSVAGFDILTQRKEIHRAIGIVFDNPNLYDEMSGYQNLVFAARLYGVAKPNIDNLLKKFTLEQSAHKKVKTYSKGMKQKLLIARALLHDPRILFLDEPTTGLDPHAAKVLRELILELARQDLTIFLTTHYISEADYLCDQVAFIDRGEIIATGSPESLKQEHSRRFVNVICNDRTTSRFHLDSKHERQLLADLISQDNITSIHSEEISLEQVYLKLTRDASLDV